MWHIQGEEKCLQDFGGETYKKETTSKTWIELGE
jgi:hypothetical protein